MWQRRPDSGTVARLRQRPNSCIPNSGDAPVLPPPNGFNGSDAPALSEAANSEAIRPDAAVSSPDGSVLRDRPPPARHASGCRFPTSPPLRRFLSPFMPLSQSRKNGTPAANRNRYEEKAPPVPGTVSTSPRHPARPSHRSTGRTTTSGPRFHAAVQLVVQYARRVCFAFFRFCTERLRFRTKGLVSFSGLSEI